MTVDKKTEELKELYSAISQVMNQYGLEHYGTPVYKQLELVLSEIRSQYNNPKQKPDVIKTSTIKISLNEDDIEEMIGNFDFNKVHKVMKHLNWKWLDIGVPDIEEMKKTARELLNSLKDKQTYSATGGFVARRNSYDFSLSFEVEEVNSHEW